MKQLLKLAVLGQDNIAKYSLSPLIHNTFLNDNNINGEYIAIPVLPENIGKELKKLQKDGYTGVNLTIPHKINAIKFLDSLDDTASKIGAVNTILFKDAKMIGYNTDCYGFIENLNRNIPDWRNRDKVLVIGAGGATRAILYALKKEKVNNITIVNRTLEKAQKLAEEFDCNFDKLENINNIISSKNLIINTTSAGMNGINDLNIDFTKSSKDTIVYDIIYTPLSTSILTEAQKFNLKNINGLGMLLLQAEKAFEIWLSIKPKITDNLIKNCIERLK